MNRFPFSGNVKRHTCKVGLPLAEQPNIGHNRWHPDIPPIDELYPGEEVIVEMPGYDDYQLKNTDDVRDVETLDLTRAHPIAGPIAVKGAEPGDLLVVDVLEVESLSGIGYSAIIPGIGGILKDKFPHAFKTVWDIRGAIAESRHIPGVKIPGIPHPGIIGVAPSKELLEKWYNREFKFFNEGKAFPPESKSAVLGRMPPSKYQEAVTKAARTIPPRENGGNMDIKNLSNGSRIFFPVYVKGGLLSLGDCHYAEGDGEVTWNAIEMDGAVRIRVNLIKDGVRKYGIISPVFIPGRHEPRFTEYLTFTGFSFRDDEQHYMDTTFAVRDAVLKAVDYLMRFGYTAPQAYTILSVAPIELRVSEIVDIPNACVTLYIPMEIFDSFFRSK